MNRRRLSVAPSFGGALPAEVGAAVKVQIVQAAEGEIWLRLEVVDQSAPSSAPTGLATPPADDDDLPEYAASAAPTHRRKPRDGPGPRRRWWLAAIPAAVAVVVGYGSLGAGALPARGAGPDVSVVTSRPVGFSPLPSDLGCASGCTPEGYHAVTETSTIPAVCPTLNILGAPRLSPEATGDLPTQPV